MKSPSRTTALMIIVLIGSIFSSCQKNETASNKTSDLKTGNSMNSFIYPPSSHPFGKSYGAWGAAWWRWDLSNDCDHNPIFDTDGSLQNQNQSGSVYFLAGNAGGASSRSVTIPANTAIFFPLLNSYNDFPCPDTSFHPAPGETLEHFLSGPVMALIDQVDALSMTIDGNILPNPFDYRGTSGLYDFTGNADLVNCLDNCITGSTQQAVSDGYWIMLKPLSTGEHILHFTGTVTAYGVSLDVTYNITVQ